MPRLTRDTYVATQRALKSLWYGEPAAIAEAAEYAGVSREQVEDALSEFVSLIVVALPTVPASVQDAASIQAERIAYRLTREIEQRLADYPRLSALREQAAWLRAQRDEAERPVREAQERVNRLRDRLKWLSTREHNLRRQITDLEAVVSALAAALGECDQPA